MSTKYLDESGLSYFWSKLKTLFNGKVDKVSGKGLSTNDYTTAEKNKLASLVDTSVANATQYNSHTSGALTSDTTKSKTYTASGSGVVFASASMLSSGGTWGGTQMEIYLNNSLIVKGTDLFKSDYNGQYGANATAVLKVASGDVVKIQGRSNRYQSGNTWDLYCNVLAFGCTLTVS